MKIDYYAANGKVPERVVITLPKGHPKSDKTNDPIIFTFVQPRGREEAIRVALEMLERR